MNERRGSLIAAAELYALRDMPNVRILDGTYHLPWTGRRARAEFAEAHIPGAVFFDIDAISDHTNDVPHMLPPAEEFAAIVGLLGIGAGDRVIVYDTYGLSSAARAWWMFHAFGHDDVAVLDGGFVAWKKAGLPIEHGLPSPAKRTFSARLRPEVVRRRDDVLAAIENGGAQIVDARPAGRFRGEEPEPREGLRSGHIPGSANIPVGTLTDPERKTLRPPEDLRRLFTEAGLDVDRPAIATCGSGVTAAALVFALHLIGAPEAALYDGSWAEWGRPGPTPVETGAPRAVSAPSEAAS